MGLRTAIETVDQFEALFMSMLEEDLMAEVLAIAKNWVLNLPRPFEELSVPPKQPGTRPRPATKRKN